MAPASLAYLIVSTGLLYRCTWRTVDKERLYLEQKDGGIDHIETVFQWHAFETGHRVDEAVQYAE